jgi:hypothetical protein
MCATLARGIHTDSVVHLALSNPPDDPTGRLSFRQAASMPAGGHGLLIIRTAVANKNSADELGRKTEHEMKQTIRFALHAATVFAVSGLPAYAQDTQFLPEVDVRLNLDSSVRAYFAAKEDRDAGEPQQVAIGPSVQFYLRPLIKLEHVRAFDLDESKSRFLIVETGYRYISTPGTASTDRMEAIATLNFPLSAGFAIADRNRADLDWKIGTFQWRYRNKLTIDRTVSILSRHFIPYVAAEPYYTSQYGKWSTTSFYGGSLFPVGKHMQFNAYYEYENDTGKHPNQQKNSVGLVLNLYFSTQKK